MALIGAFIYMFFGSSEVQSWAKKPDNNDQNKDQPEAANAISKNNNNNNAVQHTDTSQTESNRGPWVKVAENMGN